MSSLGSTSSSLHSSLDDPVHYRVVLMGAGRVGKTALLHRFLFDTFTEKYRETVEDLHSKTFDVNGVLVRADMLDTAGELSFPAMRRLNISSANAFVLVYKLEPDLASFHEVQRIYDEIVEIRGIERTIRYL